MSKSVLLLDHQYLTRTGISTLINSTSGFKVANELQDINQIDEAVSEFNPEIIVMDYTGQDDSLLLLKRIKKKYDSNFLIITNNQNKKSIQKLLSLGIKGIITKNCSQEEIVNALKSVALNKRFYCNRVLELVVEYQDDKNGTINLSHREQEVLEMIAKGSTTNKIAEKLFLSVHTINSHRKNILKKLNLKSPAELIVYAIENNLRK